MKLQLIDFYAPDFDRTISIRDAYRKLVLRGLKPPSETTRAQWLEAEKRMLALIKYIENEVENPQLWVSFGHANILFHHNNESRCHMQYWVEVSGHNARATYEVTYYLPPSNELWDTVSGSTESVETAARMIVEAI